MNVLVPLDGSAASLRALQLAIEQVKCRADGSLLLVNVQNLVTAGLDDGGGIMPSQWVEQEEQRVAREVLDCAQRLCEEAKVPFRTRIERGGIAATIDRLAREEKVDHIVMGTRGLGGVRGLLLGSVATQILHLVDVPVTLVK